MMMNVIVQPPMKLLREAVEKQTEVDCQRFQAVLDLFPHGYTDDPCDWRLSFVCGTNCGIGSDNGYGVGFHCSKNCKIRIPLNKKGLYTQ
jgi:hypothetical protein